MKRKTILTLVVAMLLLNNVCVYADQVAVYLQVEIIDPSIGQDEPQRGPAIIPTVEIEDDTLFLVA